MLARKAAAGVETVGQWVIEPRREGLAVRLREFVRYRKILWFFAVRTIKRMYEGTFLGKIWLLRPLIPIAIGALVFGGILGVDSGDVPYFLFFLAGSSIWLLFEQSALWITRSLDMSKGLVKKVYFPRLVVPVAAAAPAVLYFGIFMGVIFVTLLYYLFTEGRWYLLVGVRSLWAIFAMVLSVVFALAIGLWTSVWQTRFREVRITLRYVLRFWNYLTPVIYPMSKVPPEYRSWMLLNPMAAFVETFKWGTLGIGELDLFALGVAVGITGVILLAGAWYFTRQEAKAIDNL